MFERCNKATQDIVILMQQQGMKALIFGGTGAVGSQLLALLLASPRWSKVTCVVRKQPQEWANLPNSQKLQVEVFPNLDDYFKQKNTHYQNTNSLFSCFGSQVKHGEETFVKVDKLYPLWAADIAKENNIPHYLLVSSMGSNPNSWFLYPKTKGQVELELAQKQLKLLTIFRPGLLRQRKDARTIEKILGKLPFVPGITARETAEVLKTEAERYNEQALKLQGSVKILENKQMLELLKK